MPPSSPAIVHTGKDGEFVDDAARQAVDQLVANELASAKKAVLYFHGGLDDAAAGESIAVALDPVFRSAEATPVFFVWESGLLEILTHNISEIAGESFFKSVLNAVLKFASAKILDTAGARAIPGALPLPNATDIAIELSKRDVGGEPFDDLPASAEGVRELTPAEERLFTESLAADPMFRATVEEIEASVLPAPVTAVARGVSVRTRASASTLMSPEVVEELRQDRIAAQQVGARGLLSSGLLIKKAATVLVRVIRRFNGHRDHGLYPTVVEEILREFYIANVGGKIWAAMKGETSDTFQPAQPLHGGQYFVAKLAEVLQTNPSLEITLVGHSTGAVFINNLLKYAQQQRSNGALPPHFRFKNIILLAPASTFHDFANYVKQPYTGEPGRLYESLHIFAMSDETESRDVLVRGVYTRSLLYFVSGVLETGPDGKSATDVPIVGMQRYYTDKPTYADQCISDVRDFVALSAFQPVWSPAADSQSKHHGGFAADPDTRNAMISIIQRS